MRSLLTGVCLGVVVLLGCDGESTSDAGSDSASPCLSDTACDDGLFCNGAESCDPASAEADARGCVQGVMPCADACDEGTDACTAGCPDADGDGHQDAACGGDDCDDADPRRFPGNTEVCPPEGETHDEDCNDETLGPDRDGDGLVSDQCCNGDVCGTDCDDADLTRRPGQLEICDAVDNDCDESVDEEENRVPWYPDTDGDGFGDPMATAVVSCSPVLDHSLNPRDCDDTRPSVSPVGVEGCNARDDDCDTMVDEGLTGCMPDAGPPDAGPPDAGPPDAGPPDAGPPDAGPPDAGPPDAGPVCMPAVYGTSVLGASCYQ